MDLIENKELLQAVFDAAPNGIAVLQPVYNEQEKIEDFTTLLLNSYSFKWISDTEYKGKRYSDLFPLVKENNTLQKFITIAETGNTNSFEQYYNSGGAMQWFRFTAVKQSGLLVVTTEDITEHKVAEAALNKVTETTSKQQRIYDSITSTTPDLVYVFDPSYRFTYANKALLNMWGKTAEDAIGKGLRENGYEEWHAQMHEREIDDVLATHRTIRGTVSFPHAELGSRVYDYIFGPVLNEQGEVEAIAGITRDITELKKAEENLQQSESRFRNMIEQAPVAMLLSRGEDMIIEIINEPMLPFLNKTSIKDAVGQKLLNTLPELVGQPVIDTVMKVQLTGIPFRGNEQPVDFNINGQLVRRYLNLSYDCIKETGKSNAVLHMAIDVTEQVLARKKLEESKDRLKSVIDQTPAPTLVLRGDDFIIEHINDSMLEMIGHGEKVIGQPFLSVMPEIEGQFAWEQMKKVYHKGIEFNQEEVLLSHKRTGVMEDYYYTIGYRPLKENGVITGMIQVAIDITESVKAKKAVKESEHRYKALSETLEQQVNDRTKELQRSNDDLQQFAHVASHDLREPVRKIKTFTSRLEEQLNGSMDATASRYIERIHVATDRMFNMIEGVLAYSTINAGTQHLEPVNLNEIIKNIETDLEVSLQRTGGSIHYKNLPTLEGAGVLIYQLFYNLINNSIKFAKADEAPVVTISSSITAEPSGSIATITVEDNGIGFEPGKAAQIFETFMRLNSKDKYEGTGLGLSLCKKIVERHGGNITANATLDKGAVFTITLPLQQKATSI